MESRIITSTNQLTMASSTTNASMELIPGMDKLLGYMKAQDNKIKQLTQENKKLQEEIKHKNEKFSEWCEENNKLTKFKEEVTEIIQTEESHLASAILNRFYKAFEEAEEEDEGWEEEDEQQ